MQHARASDLPSKSECQDGREPHIFIKGLLWSCLLLASMVFAPSALAHAEHAAARVLSATADALR